MDNPQNREPKTSEKYIILLKYVNLLLVGMGKPEINDLIEFVDIDKNDIITEQNMHSFNEMKNELFAIFDKKKCGYYYKTKNQPLNSLRSFVKDIGYNIWIKQRNITEYVNNKTYQKTHTFYTITL
jgi:hypothetical protein